MKVKSGKQIQIFYSISCLCLGLLFAIVFSEYLRSLNKIDRLVSWESLYLTQYQGQIDRASQQATASNRPECVKDRYSVEEIQRDIDKILAEVYQLEPYNRPRREWRGIPLEGLPLGHVNYFLKAGGVLSEDVNVSRCRTAPCVFNTVYGESPEHIYGYVAFLFFLKTGYVLSGIVYNPDRGIDVSSLDDLTSFYFKEKEFYWIWLWLQSTSEKMFHLRTLQNIYRLPHGVTAQSGGVEICGKANASGWIWLADDCLVPRSRHSQKREWWKNEDVAVNMRSGGVMNLAHEVAHHYDFSAEKRGASLFDVMSPRIDFAISSRTNFLSFSGWNLTEYVDNNGLPKERWQHSEGQELDGLVIDHAIASPMEDFAESLAAFRYYPQMLKDIAPKKFEFFKTEIFEGRSYDEEGINEFLNSEILLLIRSEKRQWLSACLLAQSGEYADFTPLAFDREVRQEFINHGLNGSVFDCFMSNMDQAVEALFAEFKFETLEGCSMLSDREKDWWHEVVFRREVPSLVEILDNAEEAKQVALQVQAFRDQFERSFNGEEIAIDCYQEGLSEGQFAAEQCFTNQLALYIGQVVRNYLMLDGVTLNTEMERLRSTYNYSRFYREAGNRVKRVIQISSLDMTGKAEEFVDSCSNFSRSYSDEENLYSPYRGIETITLRPWFLNCINKNYEGTLIDLLEKARGDYATLDREFQRFIYGVYSDDFLLALDNSVQGFIDREEYRTRLSNVRQEVLSALRGDSSWYLARHLEESILEACLRRAGQLIDAQTYNMIFSSIQSLPVETCSQLQEEEPYKSLFSKGLISFYGDTFSEYWKIISDQWDIAKQECGSKKLCLSLKVIPVLHRSWEMLGESVTAQYTRGERRRIMKAMILRIKSLF